jgi:hypothetical protein
VVPVSDQSYLNNLFEKLKQFLSTIGDDNKLQSQLLRAAAKRCLKKVLNILSPDAPLGDPMNYETMKDLNLAASINSSLNSFDLSFSELRSMLDKFSKLAN